MDLRAQRGPGCGAVDFGPRAAPPYSTAAAFTFHCVGIYCQKKKTRPPLYSLAARCGLLTLTSWSTTAQKRRATPESRKRCVFDTGMHLTAHCEALSCGGSPS